MATYERLRCLARRRCTQNNVAHYRALAGAHGRDLDPRPRGSTPPSRGRRWASTRAWPPTPCSAPGSSPASGPRGRASGPGSPGCSGATRCGPRSRITSAGDFAATRTALDFLRKYQRADGKIPHEISQSASLVPWWTDYEFPWASADATPLYVIAHGDHWSATGDRAFLDASWESIVKAWRFSSETDRDGNGLIENTKVGPRLDGRQPALSAARGDLPAGRLDRGLAGHGRDGGREGRRRAGRGRPRRRARSAGRRWRRPTG